MCAATLLFPLTVLLLTGFTAALAPDDNKWYFISAPNVIRVGVDETFVINIFGDELDTGDNGIPISVSLQSHPVGTTTFDTTSVNVKKNEPKTITLRVNPDTVPENPDPNEPQYVYLHARCTDPTLAFEEGTPILLSYKAGYVFLQTDKPIYTPNQQVNIRLVTVNQQMRPSEEQVRIEIQTPQGITVKRYDNILPDAGFVSQTYAFPGVPAFGNWSVVAYYGHEMQHNSTIQFLVKEYVLPTFSVKVVVQPVQYILPSSEQVITVLQGEYVFGERVTGFYRIKYSLLDEDGSLELIKDVANISLNSNDQAIHTLSLSDVKGTKDFDEFLGKKLHIEAFIIEGATGKIESANNSVLEFVNSPFKFSWAETMKYFKKNLPFEVKADVFYSHGEPATELNVIVSAVVDTSDGPTILEDVEMRRTDSHGRVSFTLNVPDNALHINVTMTTAAGGDLEDFQRSSWLEILRFDSEGNDEILIRPKARNLVMVTETINVDLERTSANNEIVDVIFTYIVAGGKIIQPKAVDDIIATTVTDIEIMQDMVPSARMVAFYVNSANKVVADMAWIDVEDQCENPVEISIPAPDDGRTWYKPKNTVNLKVMGKPHTKVALLGVDSAVYLLQDYHRLNKKKIFSKMASYDLGCGPGGGSNTQDIFDNAGITVLTNAELHINEREDLGCNNHDRKRRNVEETTENIQELLSFYQNDAILFNYCKKGQRYIEDWSCEDRKLGIMSRMGLPINDPIVQALYKCCVAESQAAGRSSGSQADQIPKADYSGVAIRSDFRESFLFEQNLVDLGDATSAIYPISLPDSITTWIIQATGVSPLHGMCVAEPMEITVRREHFIDVTLPYSVMRMEQVALVATVFNYRGEPIRVAVEMAHMDGLCSNARPDAGERMDGVVESNSVKAFTFIVIPLEVQDYEITFYTWVLDHGSDAIRKVLHVVHEGVPKVIPLSIVLDPAGVGRQIPVDELPQVVDGPENSLKHNQSNDQPKHRQIDEVYLALPEDAVPETAKCEVSVMGSLMGPIANAVIEGLETGSFLNKPQGCGEQTMIYTAPNVYIYKYFKSIDQDTKELEERATAHIEAGIAREVQHYRTDDGAFKTFSGTPGNSWLTAFVLRVISAAKGVVNGVDNDNKIICEGLKWLSDIQNADGSFNFTYKTWHGSSFMGGVDEPVPLTAFILVTFSESNCPTLETTRTVSRATTYLEGKLDSIAQDHHSLALVTYALALVNNARAVDANTQLRTLATDNLVQGTKYFGSSSSGPLTVETTAYALLAQITLGEIGYSYPIVLWLMSQRDQIGYWRSTQDTMVALQALSEYAQRAETGEINMECEATATADNEFRTNWQIQADSALLLQSTRAAPVKGVLVVRTLGTGIATLSVNLHYNKASGSQNLCPFNVTITSKDLEADPIPEGEKAGNAVPAKSKLSIKVCAKYLGEGQTNMAIIDVGLLSGFTPITKSLKEVISNTPLIQMYEVSDRSVVFYAHKIPGQDSAEPLCVTFEAEQPFKVGNVQPVPVKVYDYYLPDKECIKFYRPDGGSPILPLLCEGGACECAAAHCLNQSLAATKKLKSLKDAACMTAGHFAYKASYESYKDMDTFEVYTMTITPLKTGLDTGIQAGQRRSFWKNKNCQHPILEADNDYLIVGKGGIPIKDDDDQVIDFKYFINGDFIITHWPRTNTQYVGDDKETCLAMVALCSESDDCKAKCKAIEVLGSQSEHCKKSDCRWKNRKNIYADVQSSIMDGCDQ